MFRRLTTEHSDHLALGAEGPGGVRDKDQSPAGGWHGRYGCPKNGAWEEQQMWELMLR